MIENTMINNTLIKQLTKTRYDQIIENKQYKFIGKGGDGVIYSFDDIIIKIYTRFDMDLIFKEFYVVGLLQEVDSINLNIIIVYRYYLSLSNPVLLMEKMDGNLSTWSDAMIRNAYNMSNNELEISWLSMIFQVSYGFVFLNQLRVLHNDAKPKNVLFLKQNEIYHNYQINNKTYKIPINNLFKIADFGAIQIIGSTLNKMSDMEIQQKIDNRSDLKELSRIIFRLMVDYAKKTYDIKTINPYIEKNDDFRKYRDVQIKEIEMNPGLKKLPQQQKNNYLLRSLLYYGLENKIIDQSDIIIKNRLIMPSDKVLRTLDALIDITNEKLFDTFDSSFLDEKNS